MKNFDVFSKVYTVKNANRYSCYLNVPNCLSGQRIKIIPLERYEELIKRLEDKDNEFYELKKKLKDYEFKLIEHEISITNERTCECCGKNIHRLSNKKYCDSCAVTISNFKTEINQMRYKIRRLENGKM